MKVKAIMTPATKLTLLSPSDTVKNAIDAINEKGILSLPVVEDKKFVGFLSKQFVYETYFNEGLSDITSFLQRPLSMFMHNKIAPISPDLPIEQAAKIFFDHNIRFIPVVDAQNIFQGIVTQKVLFGLLTKIYGLEDPQIIVTTNNVKGVISRVAEIITKHGGNITNIVQLDTSVKGVNQISIRVTGKDINKIRNKIEESGYQIDD